MKKYRMYAVVTLLAAPSILVSNPGFSTSRLPEIGSAAIPVQQQNCPLERRYGCFNPVVQSGAYNLGNASFTNTDNSRRAPFDPCRQFMQMFLRLGAG